MSQAPIMPFYTDAYLADTHHLHTEAHGAYLLLLLHMWRMNGAVLADDDVMLARIARVSKAKWRGLRPLLSPFFVVEGGVWQQKKLHKTWCEVQEKIARQREKGIKGAAQKKASELLKKQDSHGVLASPVPSPSKNHEPESTISFAAAHDAAQREEIRQISLQSNYGVAAQIRLPCPNLSYLSPHVQDFRYFVKHSARKQVDPALRPRLLAASQECDALLKLAGEEVARDAVTRIFRRCPAVKAENKAALIADYTQSLAAYPADMVYAAVDSVLHSHIAAYPPLLSLFLNQMDAEMKQRHYVHKQIHALLLQCE